MLIVQPAAAVLTASALDVAVCGREPIRHPHAVQPHGAFIAAVMGSWLVSHASANLVSILGQSVEAVLGRPLGDAIGGEAGHTLTQGSWDSDPALERVCHLLQPGGTTLRLRSYLSGRRLCIDIEPIASGPQDQLPHLIAQVLQTFVRAYTSVELCELAVVGLKAITGYDRVMAYRFDADGHGEVIAEALEAHLEPFRGLHYPASDIPPQARQLYLSQRVGSIADSSYTPVPLLTEPRLDDGVPLDLTRSNLRSVSPVHREYMRNMKTAASLTVGLEQANGLWGLLVCHHAAARVATSEVRAAAGTIGQVVSLLLQSLDDAELFSERLVRNTVLRAVADRIASPLSLPDALAAAQADLLRMADARGAVLSLSGENILLGQTPPQAKAVRALTIMRPLAGVDALAIDDLGLRFPELADPEGAGGGALLMPLSLENDDAILWFRPELTSTVTWGGDPNLHGSVDTARGRISPRESFAAWEQTVSGRCAPWTEIDLAIAQELRTVIRAEVARRTVVALKERAARLGLLAEHSGVVVALSDLDGTRLFVSPASERVLGWRPEEIVSHDLLQFVHPDDHKLLLDANTELLAGGGQSSATYRFRRPDGSWLWIEEHARLRDSPDGSSASDCIVVLRDATERKTAEVKLIHALNRMEQMATTDGLTGLANRRHLDVAAEREWRRCARDNQPLSLLMVDADRFKLFNDRYGHLAGDDCLRAIAAQLTTFARRPGDVAARYGGEEFALLIPNTDRKGASIIAERLCQGVRGLRIKHHGNGDVGFATISIGHATTWPGDSKREFADVVALISGADAALYRAKSGGRNQVVSQGESRNPA